VFQGGERDYCGACIAQKGERCEACPSVVNAAQLPEEEALWAVVMRCASQVRTETGGEYHETTGMLVAIEPRVIALDMPAWLAYSDRFGADTTLLLEMLPDIERAIVGAHAGENDEPEEEVW